VYDKLLKSRQSFRITLYISYIALHVNILKPYEIDPQLWTTFCCIEHLRHWLNTWYINLLSCFVTAKHRWLLRMYGYPRCTLSPTCQSWWPRGQGVGLRPLVCWDCGFESRRWHGCLSLVSVVCCQVEVTASVWSQVRRSPTDCGVSECDQESSIMRSPRLLGAVAPQN